MTTNTEPPADVVEALTKAVRKDDWFSGCDNICTMDPETGEYPCALGDEDCLCGLQVEAQEKAIERIKAALSAQPAPSQSGLVEALLETREMLGICGQVICDEVCPTTWPSDQDQPHGKLHLDIREVLYKHEHHVIPADKALSRTNNQPAPSYRPSNPRTNQGDE